MKLKWTTTYYVVWLLDRDINNYQKALTYFSNQIAFVVANDGVGIGHNWQYYSHFYFNSLGVGGTTPSEMFVNHYMYEVRACREIMGLD